MRRFIRYSGVVAIVVAAIAVTPAPQARAGLSGMFNFSMVGSGLSPINMTGMLNMMEHMGGMMGGQMDGMMDQCRQMMQDRGSGSGKPNEQWRDGAPPARDKTDKKQ